MRSDAEIAGMLEEWLQDEARPLPGHVRISVLDELGRTGRSSVRTPLMHARWRYGLSLAAAAVAVAVVVVAVPGLIGIARLPGLSSGSGVAEQGSATFAPGCTNHPFEGPRTIDTAGTGNGPMAIVTGDFNGDGKADFVIANEASGDARIGVLLGHGNGTFGEPAAYASGGLMSLAALDADRDGKLDLVGAAGSLGQLIVLPGDGLGGFRAPRSIELGDDPRGVAVADFNGDGIPDVGFPLGVTKEVAIELGDGAGGFRPVDRLQTDGPATWIATGDFNGDGAADIAVAVAEDHLEVFLGDGHGGFGASRRVLSRIPYSVTAADMNGDGRIDLVIGAHGEAGVGVHLGDGLGGFGPVDFFGIGGTRGVGPMIVGRFTGHAYPDVVAAADGTDSSVIVLAGDGRGGLSKVADIAVGNGPLGMATADFNGDGAPDIVTSNVNVASVSLLLGMCPQR